MSGSPGKIGVSGKIGDLRRKDRKSPGKIHVSGKGQRGRGFAEQRGGHIHSKSGSFAPPSPSVQQRTGSSEGHGSATVEPVRGRVGSADGLRGKQFERGPPVSIRSARPSPGAFPCELGGSSSGRQTRCGHPEARAPSHQLVAVIRRRASPRFGHRRAQVRAAARLSGPVETCC